MSAERYLQLAHAMQSGVAFSKDKRDLEPKHLRVGVNSAMVVHGGLVELLIAKGVFTRDEYMAAITDSMQREVDTYREKIAREQGVPVDKIKLG